MSIWASKYKISKDKTQGIGIITHVYRTLNGKLLYRPNLKSNKCATYFPHKSSPVECSRSQSCEICIAYIVCTCIHLPVC